MARGDVYPNRGLIERANQQSWLLDPLVNNLTVPLTLLTTLWYFATLLFNKKELLFYS